MGNIQIKNVPNEVHEELRRRANLSGLSVRDYLLRLIRKDQSLPPKEEWLERVRRLPRTDLGISAADLIREGREERERQLMETLGIHPDDDTSS